MQLQELFISSANIIGWLGRYPHITDYESSLDSSQLDLTKFILKGSLKTLVPIIWRPFRRNRPGFCYEDHFPQSGGA